MIMRLLFLFVFLLTLNRSTAQPIPFQVTFSKMYLGYYSTQEHRTIKLQLSEIDIVNTSFDGNIMNVKYQNYAGTIRDSMKLSLTLQDVTPGSDFVEYKYVDVDGFVVFLRYNRYYIPGILEMSIFHPGGENFLYIKRKVNGSPTK